MKEEGGHSTMMKEMKEEGGRRESLLNTISTAQSAIGLLMDLILTLTLTLTLTLIPRPPYGLDLDQDGGPVIIETPFERHPRFRTGTEHPREPSQGRGYLSPRGDRPPSKRWSVDSAPSRNRAGDPESWEWRSGGTWGELGPNWVAPPPHESVNGDSASRVPSRVPRLHLHTVDNTGGTKKRYM